jgi:hypothetical protein
MNNDSYESIDKVFDDILQWHMKFS